jgi:hypothetical protein
VERRGAEGVQITGVYGPGKGTIAAGIASLLAQQGGPYALPGLGNLGWAGSGRPAGSGLLQNLTAVAVTRRQAGIGPFVLACFAGDAGEAQRVREAAGVPLKAARLAVPPAGVGQRLTSDVTSGRREDPDEAAAPVGAREGAGLEDVVIKDDRPIRGRHPGTDDVPRMALARRPHSRTSDQACRCGCGTQFREPAAGHLTGGRE